MTPSTSPTMSSTTAAWGADTDIAHGAHPVDTPSSFPWSLPAHEVEKMERLEQGGTLGPSTMVGRCLDRLAEVEAGWPDSPFRRTFLSSRRPKQPSAEEVEAMIAEVPLCLLSARQRLQALALRQHGPGESAATAAVFDTHATRNDLIIATMDALHAARGNTGAAWTRALAKLARWEVGVGSERDAEARASGGRALREVVKDALRVPLHLDGQGLTRERAREFSLPPPALLAELDLGARDFVAILRHARPLDLDSFRDSLTALDLRSWSLFLNDGPDVRLPLIPNCAEQVDLWGDSTRCGLLAVALAGEPGRELRQVHIHPHEPAAEDTLPPPPSGWRVNAWATSWMLSREKPVEAKDPAAVLAFWGAEDPGTLWTALDASSDGQRLVDFLAESKVQMTALGPADAAIVRDEMTTRSRSLLQRLAAEPALLSDLTHDLAGPWTCIDAKRKTLASMELTLRAGSDDDPALLLLRMSLLHLADLHVGRTERDDEPVEHSLALQALLDVRLAQLTGASFIRTGTPYFAEQGGMRNRVMGREPTLDDWSDSQRIEVEQILGNEVRGDFPMLREFMQSKSGAAYRAVETLRLDPSYQTANDEWEQRFLEAGERAEENRSDADALRRYAEIQQQMPLALDQLTFALMDEWLDPLRKAYPASSTS